MSVFARALTEAGYEVVSVKDCRTALNAAVTADTRHDLVITNNWLWGMSGFEVNTQLRRSLPGIPILHVEPALHTLADRSTRGLKEKHDNEIPRLRAKGWEVNRTNYDFDREIYAWRHELSETTRQLFASAGG